MSAADTITPAAIDYSVAAEFAREVRAFAMIESGENEMAVGDNGQAFGIVQMHPATFKRYYGSNKRFPQSNSDTWTQAQIKCNAAFLAFHGWTLAPQADRDLIVQAWNLGETAVYIDGRRNPEYLVRWLEAYAQIRSQPDAS